MTLCSSAAGLFLSNIKHTPFFFFPFNSCVFVPVAILETLYIGLFYPLFVWHLAGVPQGEVHSVAVVQIKG